MQNVWSWGFIECDASPLSKLRHFLNQLNGSRDKHFRFTSIAPNTCRTQWMKMKCYVFKLGLLWHLGKYFKQQCNFKKALSNKRINMTLTESYSANAFYMYTLKFSDNRSSSRSRCDLILSRMIYLCFISLVRPRGLLSDLPGSVLFSLLSLHC